MKASEKVAVATVVSGIASGLIIYWLVPAEVHWAIPVFFGVFIGLGVGEGIKKGILEKRALDSET